MTEQQSREMIYQLKALVKIMLKIETEMYVMNATLQKLNLCDYMPGTTKDESDN